ncbi:MAG: 1,4-dihydroxy-2-naphthoate polyprenyltransferase [Actinomycetota bacterium]
MKYWVEAARPRTLVAGIVPVLVGTAVSDRFSAPRFLGALVVAVFMQVGVNFANDYFDAVKGVDTTRRLGPRRLTSAGLISPGAMRNAMVVTFLVAVLAGLGLAAAAGWELAVVGAVSLLAALGYSGGPWPYASHGLGEVFVFIFFGVVATVGSSYVQIESVASLALVASVPVGLLATAILLVNNLRDIHTDAATGKRTLAVMLGTAGTQRLYRATLAGAFLGLGPVGWAAGSALVALPVLSLPLAVDPWRRVATESGRGLIAVLVSTAKLQLVFGALMAVGLWWVGR